MVSWESYVWDVNRQADLSIIREFEINNGISFPKDYVEVVKLNQGRTPEPANFTLPNSKFVGTLNVLLHFDADKAEEVYSVEYNYEIVKEYLPSGIIPFVSTINNDLICFDYRNTKTDPSIVLASHEYSGNEAIFKVADSFSEFIEGLYEEK